MQQTMYDLTIKTLPDGGISLEQSAGRLEGPAYIDLHRAQIRLIAEAAGLLAPNPAPTWPLGFERRMLRLRNKAAALADFLGSIPSFPPRAGMDEDEQQAHDLWQSIDDLMVDFGMVADDEPVTPMPTDAGTLAPQAGGASPMIAGDGEPHAGSAANEQPGLFDG
jgi:hypothetical protein